MAVIGATHRSRLGAVYNTPHPISYDAALRNFCTSLEELEDKGIESGEGEVMWCAYWMENTAMFLYNNGGFYQCCMLKFEEGAEDNNITVFPLGDFNTTTEWLRAFGIKHIIRHRSTKNILAHVVDGHLGLPQLPPPSSRGRS